MDANVGVARKLALEPNIKGPRGYLDINDDNSKLNDVNLFTAAELLTPMGNTHDESIRLAMASKQSGHIIPVEKSSPVLISNGVEQTIQYSLSKDFIVTAEDDGEVVELDDNTGIMIVKYKNGKIEIPLFGDIKKMESTPWTYAYYVGKAVPRPSGGKAVFAMYVLDYINIFDIDSLSVKTIHNCN